MTTLSEAIRTELLYERHSGTKVYLGAVSRVWTIGAVPHGGYIAALLTSAAVEHQQSTPHLDPASLSVAFLTPAVVGPIQVDITTFSTTKRWTRLDLELSQPESSSAPWPRKTIATAHAMFTTLPEHPTAPEQPSETSVTLLPDTPSEYARWCPLLDHPATCERQGLFPGAQFKEHCSWAEPLRLVGDANEGRDADGQKMLEWGAWMDLPDEDVRSNPAFTPFFADMFKNGSELLPKDQRPGRSWFPTLNFVVEWKARFPLKPSPNGGSIAKHTCGLYSVSKFVQEGKHDMAVEVWSAPSDIGERGIVVGSDEWRKEARILGVSTQLALVVPFEINERRGKL